MTPRHGKGVKGVKGAGAIIYQEGLCLGVRGPRSSIQGTFILRHLKATGRSRLAFENPGQKRGREGRKGGGEEIEIEKARPANPTGESLQGDDRVGTEDGSQ